jgi:hypothetical protein
MDTRELNDFKKSLRFAGTSGFRVISREGTTIEFKESFNWNSKDKYGKSAAAFANNRGGYIVFGVKDNPRELVGLQTTNFEDTDEAKITQYLNGMFSPAIEFEKETREVRGKKVGVLFIRIAKRKPVVAIKNDGDIKDGEIYYRYIARNDKIKFPELREILDQIQETERKQWMDLFERISRIGPENTAVMDIVKGKIDGPGGTIVIDHKLVPKLRFIKEGSFQEHGTPVLKLIGDVKPVSFVGYRKTSSGSGLRITNDPSAPAMRIEEESLLKKFSLDFPTLTRQLRARYSDFKTDNKYHKLRRELMGRGFSFVRKLNPKRPRSAEQNFYTPRIIAEFDKHYTKK